jgi:Patatin-like phospholipase
MANITKPAYGFEVRKDSSTEQLRYVFYIDPPPVRVLSFKGGGARVIVYNKFLEEYHNRGLLQQIEEIGGSSSGSVAAVFAAIHYENPRDRVATIDAVSNVNKEDIYGHTAAWKFYRVVTAPLYILSKPLQWLSKGINWIAAQCNKILPGKIIGIPLSAN